MNPTSAPPVYDLPARVSQNRDLGASHFLLTLEAEPIAATTRPGQFVMLRFAGCVDPLLPRPMSVSDRRRPKGGCPGRIQILHKVVGRGTDRLSRLRPGETLQVLGPLGRPFTIPQPSLRGRQALMVAGGIGVAIFPMLVRALRRRGCEPVLLFGARSSRDLVRRDWFARRGVRVILATEDGSEGARGLVTAPLQASLQAPQPPLMVYACGPQPMLKAVAALVNAAGIPAQLSLESYMGCGIGACLGCVVKVRARQGFEYRRICLEGPTFAAAEILWE